MKHFQPAMVISPPSSTKVTACPQKSTLRGSRRVDQRKTRRNPCSPQTSQNDRPHKMAQRRQEKASGHPKARVECGTRLERDASTNTSNLGLFRLSTCAQRVPDWCISERIGVQGGVEWLFRQG
ncbi:uncharacterized protein VDAG_08516 [Verticillium dahliae VdLs.17]|uniref:Uncharacterized protein n=1 Tax=Verticillium dahliae (strain VdLs.17 / ATCC MYA-4575 / FGSC 10137) TaxID=498257 RepID=G2XED1_VERDV|nr:uncharacterized protein VDAG_08516 [Verticillium dahliae VdLs.17]EGY18182.1 hypothetical protein VDAG_08516 [Verticillium dahliae VdLs.17]